ncbi:hypothetical protein MJG53_011845 [Ovis ammon polii x Ovis aries]|uniref:Uncharacterized protein n=1 Tax=Ovis ammon polii x Ovis aries TaxID=2918886 RepID=A0ACB9UPL6_9CETA|nr:hypothetical protein MJG53_011845 [Ovis ammon polii x Ovis aries]
MAASEDESSCLVSRGRSQSDPSVLTDSSATSSADAGENPGKPTLTPRPCSSSTSAGLRLVPWSTFSASERSSRELDMHTGQVLASV